MATVIEESDNGLDPVQLRSFLVVGQTRSFTQAAGRLGLSQSTVSLHVRKLEARVDRILFSRDTHRVELTADGEAMTGFARSILELNDRVFGYFSASALRGRVRFGASEDFVLSHLPDILRAFRESNPLVDLELTVGGSAILHETLRARELDLVLAKRVPDETHGRLVWRDNMVWAGAAGLRIDPAEPVPLILYPAPSVSREVALKALNRHDRQWRVVCTASSLSGLRAAAAAGLGVVPHARGLIPHGLTIVPSRYRLPDLGDIEFVLLDGDRTAQEPTAALARAILANQHQLQESS
jgi:DNA-binding transcriptional LysR family regulator